MDEILSRKLLILDLDETLVAVLDAPLARSHDFMIGSYPVYKRPGVDHFLTVCQEWFYLAVWSSASPNYVLTIVNHLFPKFPPVFVWDVRRCTRRVNPESETVTWRKNISKVTRLGYDLDAIIAIDDSSEKWETGYGNLVRVTPFIGDYEDDELAALIIYLDRLRREEKIRTVEKRGWKRNVIEPKDTMP